MYKTGKNKIHKVCIISQEMISQGIFDLKLEDRDMASRAMAGQFVMLYCRDESRLLARPISVCEADAESGMLRLVYRVAGRGTAEFSRMKPGERARILGPLGNGFPMDDIIKGAAERAPEREILLIGGGIGIPPMLMTARELSGRCNIVLGYRDGDTFLAEEFRKYGDVYIATEDGSRGSEGTVLDAVRDRNIRARVVCACGPEPMLRAVKRYAENKGIECWLSLEERMACGIGACLACVHPSAGVDRHTNVKNKRVCREGPVFNADEVLFEGKSK